MAKIPNHLLYYVNLYTDFEGDDDEPLNPNIDAADIDDVPAYIYDVPAVADVDLEGKVPNAVADVDLEGKVPNY